MGQKLKTTLRVPVGHKGHKVNLKIYETHDLIRFHYTDHEGKEYPCVCNKKQVKATDLIVRIWVWRTISEENKKKLHLLQNFSRKSLSLLRILGHIFYKEYVVDKEFHKDERCSAPEIREASWLQTAKGIEYQEDQWISLSKEFNRADS